MRTALLGFILIPVILVITLGGSYSLQNLEQQVESRMQEDIELIARAIRLPLSHALERDRSGSIQQALDSAFEIDRVYGVYVYDESGKQIAGSGSARARVQTEEAAKLALAGDQRGEFGQAGNERVFSYFVPLTDTGGRISGLLQVTRRGSDFSNYLTRVRTLAIFTLAGIGIFLTIVVLVGHFGAVGKYLRRIEESLTGIGASATLNRIKPEGPAEIRVLARGINRMLDRIEKSRGEIDRRRVRELELRSRLQQSEKLAAIGQLASGIAHELGTPLSTIDGKAQQLLRRSGDETYLQKPLTQIRHEASRMEQIIRQLLDFGRNNPLELVETDCASIIRSVVDKIREIGEKSDVDIKVVPPARRIDVRIDRVRIEQAVFNLLRNAVQACQHQVCIHWLKEEGNTLIRIEDDGPGIDVRHHPYLFDPFFTTKSIGEGTGMGLSVAHTAISDHGGHIEAGHSEALGGASFTIVFEGGNHLA